MIKPKASCFKCAEPMKTENTLLGYPICQTCERRLVLMQDKTVLKHKNIFDAARKLDDNLPSYLENVEEALQQLERDYIRKRIKLLHIKERLISME